MSEATEHKNDGVAPQPASAGSGGRAWLSAAALPLIVALAAVLRWFRIGQSSMWIDEGASMTLARMPWPDFLRTVWQYEANQTTYYLILRAWLRLGDSEVMVRSLSALCGTATVAAIYFLGRRLFGARAGLLAAVLLSVNMFHLWFSQEARSYSLVMLLGTLSFLFFVEAVGEPRRNRAWIGYVATSVLAVYGHMFAVLVIAGQWMAVGPRRLREIGLRRTAVVLVIQALLLTPMAAFLLRPDQGQVNWIPPTSLGMFLTALLAVSAFNPLMAILMLVGLAWSFKRLVKAGEEAFELRLAGLGLAFPIVAVALVSIVRPLFFFRYFAICVPAATLLAARALSPARALSKVKRILVAALAVLTLSVSLLSTTSYFAQMPNWGGDWRSATEYVLAHRQAGDAVAFNVSAGLDCYRYYRDRVPSRQDPAPLPTVVFPRAGDLASRHLVAPYALFRGASETHPRLWVVFHQRDLTPLPKPFPEPYRLVEEKTFSSIRPEMRVSVALYELPAR
jgi:mannosyltransferase